MTKVWTNPVAAAAADRSTNPPAKTHVPAVDQPAGDQLEAGIGPEKGREQKAELRGDREIRAIDVVDEDRSAQPAENPEETAWDA